MSGLGGRPRNIWLAKIVTFKNPQAARQAARKMDQLYRRSKGEAGRVLIVRSADLATRRALANASNRRVDPLRRRDMRAVAKAYRNLVTKYKPHVNMNAPRSNPKISRSYFRGGIR